MLYSLDRFIKHALQIPLGQGRALKVLDRLDLLGHLHGLFVLDRGHLSLSQLFADFGVVSEIEFGADEYNGYTRRVVLDLWVPLSFLLVSCKLFVLNSDIPTFALTLSNDEGLTMEKQIRKTSVWGYDSGRSLS